jgi:hypothetical protein
MCSQKGGKCHILYIRCMLCLFKQVHMITDNREEKRGCLNPEFCKLLFAGTVKCEESMFMVWLDGWMVMLMHDTIVSDSKLQ